MTVADLLTAEATAALLGAAIGVLGGWGLGLITDVFRARRDRRVAALLIATELVPIASALSTLRVTGLPMPPLPGIARPLWEAHGKALLYGGDLGRAGVLNRAYSTASEIAVFAQEPSGRDFTTGSDAKLVDDAFEEALAALTEVLTLARLPNAEIENRIGAMRHRHANP